MAPERSFTKGDKVRLTAGAAEAYGVPRDGYTVLTTRADSTYKRTWVYIAEWAAPYNVVPARELRHQTEGAR